MEKQSYHPRNSVNVQWRVDKEAVDQLRVLVPQGYGIGQLVSRLVHEHVARIEAKREMQREQEEVLV